MRSISELEHDDIREMMEHDKGFHTDIQCECGVGHLVVRSGYDKFLGCSEYPRCDKVYKPAQRRSISQAMAFGISSIARSYWRDTEMYGLEDELDEMFPGGIHCADDM